MLCISKNKAVLAAGVVAFAGIATLAWAAQDRYTLKALNGISFAEIKGYDTWPTVSVSQVEDGIKVIVGNPALIAAYKSGIPNNGKPFPDGVKFVKIEWSQKKNPESPYYVMVPDKLMSVSLIEKDSKRFPDTSGWGYAQFLYDTKTKSFKSFGVNKSFGKDICYSCHTAVAKKDYIFTAYSER
jgi:hypothetical protein